MSKILQINVGRSRASLDLTLEYSVRNDIDVICITEPPKLYKGRITSTLCYEQVTNENVAILYNKKLKNIHEVHTNTTYIKCIGIKDILIMSVYCPPNMEVEEPFEEILEVAERHIKVLITGDFNCRTTATSTLAYRARDTDFEHLQWELGVQMENDDTPTLVHQGRLTVNDYTLTRGCTVKNWTVLVEEITLSDHRYIQFDLEVNNEKAVWISHKVDEEKFMKEIEDCPMLNWKPTTDEETQMKAEIITEWITHCMDKSTTVKECKQKVYWWTEELQCIKSEIKKLSRRKQRVTDDEMRKELSIQIKAKQKELKYEIGKTKLKKWREFTGLQHAWGKPYKVVVKTKEGNGVYPHLVREDGTTTKSIEEATEYLMMTKFPTTAPNIPNDAITEDGTEANDTVTNTEITNFLKKCSNRSSPGIDRINWKVMKLVNKTHPELLRTLYADCLKYSVFPSVWKQGKVVWLLKAGKDKTKAGSYRPLTLLSTVGKLYEKIIDQRIKSTFQFSPRQYGFQKGRSTEDCLHDVVQEVQKSRTQYPLTAMTSLDIAGAFDHVSWPHTINELQQQGVPTHIVKVIRSYYKNRQIMCGDTQRGLCCGCPQGSVLGPTLWNVTYNSLLVEMISAGMKIYAYADDTLLVTQGRNKAVLEEETGKAIQMITQKLAKRNLELNIMKTEIVVMGTIISTTPTRINVRVNGARIKSGLVMKYLGVMVDWQLSWDPHVEYLCEKAEKTIPKIIQICQNTYGYSTRARRTMLYGTVGAYFRYAATCYSHTLTQKTAMEKVEKIHRRMLLCIGRLYKTVTYLATCAITGCPPLTLEIAASAIKTAKKKKWSIKWKPFQKPPEENNAPLQQYVEEEVLRIWGKMWTECNKAQWTHKMIPEVSRDTPEVSFYTAQALSAHGCFRSYLLKYKKVEHESCKCRNERETAEHVLQECEIYNEGRPETLDWSSKETLDYMERTMKQLWQTEREETMNGVRRLPMTVPPLALFSEEEEEEMQWTRM